MCLIHQISNKFAKSIIIHNIFPVVIKSAWQQKKVSKKFISIVLLMYLIFPFVASASSTDGTIDSTYKYAWGENIGWINFGTSQGNVHVTDSGLSGYALSETVGWINLDNVVNDGEGNLSGYAWAENAGWIKFNPTNGGVVINSSGEFTGSALGENTGWIIFDCDYQVKTDWRPQSARPAPAPSGGSGRPPGSHRPPTPPFKVLINDNAILTNDKNITLKLTAGSDTKRMAISNNSDFKGAGGTGQIAYQSPYSWDLCYWQKECPDGVYTVYVKFYTQYGRASEVVSDTIILRTTEPEVFIEEMTLEEIKAKILEIQQQIIELLTQLIQLIQEQITELQR